MTRDRDDGSPAPADANPRGKSARTQTNALKASMQSLTLRHPIIMQAKDLGRHSDRPEARAHSFIN